MKKQLSIAANSSFLMIGKLVQRIFSFFTVIFIARSIGPEKYGILSYIISFVTLAAIFWNFGINTVVTRSIAMNSSFEREYLGGGIIAKSGLFVICLPAIYFYFYSTESREILFSAIVFSLATFLGNLCGVFNSMFIALRRMDFSGLIQILKSIALFVSVYVVSLSTVDLPRITGCYFFAFFFATASAITLSAFFFVLPKLFLQWSFINQIIKASIPFFLISAVNIFLFRIDHIMVSKMVGNLELGYYSAAYTIFEVLISFFPMLIMSSAFPVLSNLYANDIVKLKELYKLLFKYFIWLSVPMSIGLAILARQICLTFYGQEYMQAGNLLLLLACGVWIFFMSTLVSWILTACHRQAYVLNSNLIAMIANIIFNFIFIPRFGANGAAGITLVCELFNFVYMLIALKTIIPIPKLGKAYYLRILIALVIMSVPLLLFNFLSGISGVSFLLCSTVFGGLLYGISSVLLKTVDFSEIKIFKQF